MLVLAIVESESGERYLFEVDDPKAKPRSGELARFNFSRFYWRNINYEALSAAEELAVLAFDAGVQYGKKSSSKTP